MDKYIIIKKIGEGSFGKALLVKSKNQGKQFVVKEINMSRMSKKERDEARKETAVLAQLNHTNIVTYRESFEDVGNLYIVMDYCDGGDLYGRINAQRGILFSEDQVLDWFVQICLSLKHIHDRKILHRDIKSQNIFLTRHGIIKLGDFGIAKVLSNTVELARTCIGTPYYLSPEICENRPYNNKSDIWSLGCVLYEMTTLKHAFEAGNMKNLVVKIIRGSYPPPSAKYSYELRNLIALLFKRNPRDRPSVNAVLKKPLLQKRIKKYLSETEMQDEFSHTVMHGVKLKKQLPLGGARPLPPKPAEPTPRRANVAAPSPRYDPSSVYGQPLVRKSRDAAKPTPARAAAEPRRSADRAQAELARKKAELVERERQRRLEVRRQEKMQFAKQQKDLNARQRQQRINKAREDGWKNVLTNSDESKESDPPPMNRPTPAPRPAPAVQRPVSARDPPAREAGSYEQYHQWLDQLQQQRQAAAAYNPGGAAEAGRAAAARGAEAADKARLVKEFQDRQAAAARNRDRGLGLGLGAAAAVAPRANKPPTDREQQQADYLAKLKQIRLQNFNERRIQQEKDKFKPPAATPAMEADVRRKKIEALKAQAEERARRLKEQMEAKRAEARQLEEQRAAQQAALAAAKAVKPPSLTNVMADIAVSVDSALPVQKPPEKVLPAPQPGLTVAMEAIGAAVPPPAARPQTAPEQSDRSEIQKQKDDILRRLNARAVERPRWGQGGGDTLEHLPLEVTASAMEATGADDGVIRLGDNPVDDVTQPAASEESGDSSALPPQRRQWGGVRETVVGRLQKLEAIPSSPEASMESEPETPPAGIARATFVVSAAEDPHTDGHAGTQDSAVSLDSASADGDVTPAEDASAAGKAPPPIGSTITIVKNTAGTVVVKKADAATENGESSAATAEEGAKVDNKASNADVIEQAASGDGSQEAENKVESPRTQGSLFEKVELAEDNSSEENHDVTLQDVEDDDGASGDDVIGGDAENDSEDAEEKFKSAKNRLQLSDNVKLGLASGLYDIETTLLRTCSEPDLTKLFRTGSPEAVAELYDKLRNSSSMDGEQQLSNNSDEEDDEEDESDTENDPEWKVSLLTVSTRHGIYHKTFITSFRVDDSADDDDWATMRQSMMELLNDTDEIDPLHIKSNTQKRAQKRGKNKEECISRQSSSNSVAELEVMRETMRQVLIKTPRAAEGVEKVSVEVAPNIVAGSESWDSDDREDDDYFQEEEDDMYSRLEESRAKLESELGEDKFLKAYKTVQALHDDEEATLESGVEQVRQQLGDQEHLYPAILQLVMADGAFLEDND